MIDPPYDRVAAVGVQLVEVHRWLREQVAALRRGLGGATEAGVRPGPDLVAHCLSFCSVLSAHHADEDTVLFPVLAGEHPELRTVLAELRRDHEQVAELIRAVRALVDDRDPGPSATAGAAVELDGLAALLESHFGYEERKLAAALDARRPGSGSIDLTRVLPPPT